MLRLYDLKQSCPICKKPEECLIAEDGSACICYHIQEGSVKRCGNAGFLHILKPGEFVPKHHTSPPKPPINWSLLDQIYRSKLTACENQLELGLTPSTLAEYGMGWNEEAWTFPMKDHTGQIIGIQRRYVNGFKATVEGGTPGIFIPNTLILTHNILVVCEGLSDAATAFELGFASVGKYNYSVGNEIVPKLVAGLSGLGIVIVVGDPDRDGRFGSNELKENIRAIGVDAIVIEPQNAKDLRDAYHRGLTPRIFREIIRQELKSQLNFGE